MTELTDDEYYREVTTGVYAAILKAGGAREIVAGEDGMPRAEIELRLSSAIRGLVTVMASIAVQSRQLGTRRDIRRLADEMRAEFMRLFDEFTGEPESVLDQSAPER